MLTILNNKDNKTLFNILIYNDKKRNTRITQVKDLHRVMPLSHVIQTPTQYAHHSN